MRLAVVPSDPLPERSRARLPSDPGDDRPIDLVHLARATDGDEALEAELIAMFARQSEKLGERLRLPALARQTRADVAHRLRGSALAIGAFAVAEAAGRLEGALEGEGDEPQAELAALEGALDAARAAIAELTG
jgi:HPt (histidine-containing phosphotransfer) domain-containing protein